MRRHAKAAWIASAWLVAGTGSGAQSSIPNETQLNPGREAVRPGEVIGLGCISVDGRGADELFVLTDAQRVPRTRVALKGDPNLLRFHVGHTVEVVGRVMAGPASSAGFETFSVVALVYISTTCSA